MAHIIAIKGHSLKCPPPTASHFAQLPTLHGGQPRRIQEIRVFGIFMRFSGFLFTVFFYSLALGSYCDTIYCILFSVVFSCWMCVLVRDKTDRSNKNAVKLFFSFPIFPLFRVYLRSVICDRFLLIFRIRKTVFLLRVLVAVARVCVKKKGITAGHRIEWFTVRFRELHCKLFLCTVIQYNNILNVVQIALGFAAIPATRYIRPIYSP